MAVLSRGLKRLRSEYEAADGKKRFLVLESFLPGSRREMTHEQAAAELGASMGTLKVTIHRVRRKYRRIVREELSRTVEKPEDIDGEIRYLLTCLKS